jgi:hypothetical protein
LNVANKDHELPDFYVFGIVDAVGDSHRAVCDETGDSIYVEGLKTDGTYEHFESDAYHLRDWAEEHGFTYFCYGYLYTSLGEPLTKEMIQA